MSGMLNLKLLRISKGIKQKDLAGKIGVSGEYLRQIESGIAKNPSRKIINDIAKELEIDERDISYFFRE